MISFTRLSYNFACAYTHVFIFHINLNNSIENGVSTAEYCWIVDDNNNRMAHVFAHYIPMFSVKFSATMPLSFGFVVAVVFYCFHIHYSKVNRNTIGNLYVSVFACTCVDLLGLANSQRHRSQMCSPPPHKHKIISENWIFVWRCEFECNNGHGTGMLCVHTTSNT